MNPSLGPTAGGFLRMVFSLRWQMSVDLGVQQNNLTEEPNYFH